MNVLARTNSRVLTFNYERLFEIAFASYFSRTSYLDCYCKDLLNSGWDGTGGPRQEVAEGQFCFLKLHGSAAAWIKTKAGQARYYACAALLETDKAINDTFFWPPGHNQSPWTTENATPFIVFPHEKEGVRTSGYICAYKDYMDTIWRKAGEIVEQASEIRAIGYSFDSNDRSSVMELLCRGSKDCPIVVQNPDATSICEELRLRYPDLAARLKPVAKKF